MLQSRFQCVNGVLMAGAFTLSTILSGVLGNAGPVWAATLDRFDMSSDDQSVKIQLYSDQRVKYSTQTQGGAFIILLEDTNLSEDQVKQGFPIVMDGQKRFVGRAIPAGANQVKIVLPNLPANQFAVSIAQKSALSKVSSIPVEQSQTIAKTKTEPLKPSVGPMAIKPINKVASESSGYKTPSPRPIPLRSAAGGNGGTSANPYYYDNSPKDTAPRPRPAVLSAKPMVDEMVRDLRPLPVSIAQTTPGSQPWSSWEPKRPSKPYVSKRMRELERAKAFSAQGMSPPVSYQFERGKLIDMPPRSVASAAASTLNGVSNEPNGYLSNAASPRGIIGETLGQLDGPSAPGNSGFSFRPEQGFSALAIEDPLKQGASGSNAGEGGTAQTIEVDWDGFTQELVKGFGQGFQNIPLWAVILMGLFLGGIGFFALIAAFYLISGIFVNIRKPRPSFAEMQTPVFHSNAMPSPRRKMKNKPDPQQKAAYQSPPPQVPRYVDATVAGRYPDPYGPEYYSSPMPSDGYPTPQVNPRHIMDEPKSVGPGEGGLTSSYASVPQGSVYLLKPSQDVAEAVRKGTRLKLLRRNA